MANVDVELGEVDIVDNTVQKLLQCCQEKKENRGNQLPPTIYMVPSALRDLSPTSFNPRVVSIGPLHKEDKSVQGIEGQKPTYLLDLLCRLDSRPEQTMKACVQKVNASIERIRACYAGMKTYTDVELIKMMVLDGCFILEFIYKLSKYDKSISGNPLLIRSFIQDLVLLENQIPFFVLEYIFECTILKLEPSSTLTTILLPILEDINPFHENLLFINVGADTIDHDHILGFLQKLYQPANAKPSSPYISGKTHSVVELDRAGVNFKPNRDIEWSTVMKLELRRFVWFFWFWGKPTLRMPVLHIYDSTELVLRNLIAYEHSSSQVHCYVISYAYALDMLIDTIEDVAKLMDSKVLVNGLGSNKDAANMINNICKEVVITEFYYGKEWQQMDDYCNSYWPKHIARLRRTYFNSPWNIIALLAGIVLFALTVVQTIFTIKAAGQIIS